MSELLDIVTRWPDDLQHEGGNVIIRTSEDLKDTFILDMDVLKRRSKYFDAVLRWLASDIDRRCAEPGNHRPIFEYELVFDMEHNLPLLFRTSEAISDRQYDGVEFEKLPAIPPGESDPRPRALFRWSEPQVRHFRGTPFVYRPDTRLLPRPLSPIMYPTYLRFFRAHEVLYFSDRRMIVNEEGPPDLTHLTFRNSLHYARCLWKTLLRLIHGRCPTLVQEATLETEVIHFLANLVRLAKYYQVVGRIKAWVCDQLFAKGDALWTFIPLKPRFMLMLAWDLDCEAIYIDSMKHLISIHCLEGLTVGAENEDSVKTPRPVRGLAYIADTNFREQLARLNNQIHGIQREWSVPAVQQSMSPHPVHSQYVVIARNIITRYLSTTVYRHDSDDYLIPPRLSPLQPPRPIHKAFHGYTYLQLYRYTKSFKSTTIENQLSDEAAQELDIDHHALKEYLDPVRLRRAVSNSLIDFGYRLRAHPFMCETHAPQCDELFHNPHCERCNRARHETGERVTYLGDWRSAVPNFSDTFWPPVDGESASGSSCSDTNSTDAETVVSESTARITFAHLVRLGLLKPGDDPSFQYPGHFESLDNIAGRSTSTLWGILGH